MEEAAQSESVEVTESSSGVCEGVQTEMDIDAMAEAEATEQRSRSDSLLDRGTERKTETKPEVEAKVTDRPEGWPEDLWDKEKGVPKLEDASDRLTKAEKAANDFRKILSDKKSIEAYHKEQEGDKGVPEKYEFEILSEEWGGDRQSVEYFSNAAKEAGLNNGQANVILNKFMEQQDERSIARRDEEVKKLGEDAQGVLSGINDFINARVTNGTFSKEEGDAFAGLVVDADSARAISKVISMTGEKAIPTSMRMVSQHKSTQDIKECMVEALRKGDEKTVRELREELQKMGAK